MICNIVSIVDDDPMVRDSLVDLLNSLGFTALGFESAEKYLDSGEVKNTYCLITDQQLPGLSGTELQKYLRAEGYRTPVIFITAFPEPTVRDRACGDGAIAFLTKPFEEGCSGELSSNRFEHPRTSIQAASLLICFPDSPQADRNDVRSHVRC